MSPITERNSRSKDMLRHVVNLATFLMNLLGCQIKDGPRLDSETSSGTVKYIRLFFRGCFCFITNVLFCLYSCMMLVKLFQLTPLSSKWMKTFAFSFVFTVNAVAVIMTTWKIQRNVFRKWLDSFILYEEVYGLNEKQFSFIKRAKLVRLFGPVLCIVFVVVYCGLLNKLPTIVDSVTLDFLPSWLSLALLPFGVLMLCLCCVCHMSLLVSGSVFVMYEFEGVNDRMMDITEYYSKKSDTKLNRQNSTDGCSELTLLFRQHEKICDVLNDLGSFIKHIHITTFFASLPLGCIMVYFLITNIESNEDKGVAVALILTSLFYLITLCFTGSMINLKAHEPLKYVWKIPQSFLSETEARELLMFATKMTGPPIGYSVYNLFTITFPSSLSLAGTLLTYFIVVIQFKPSDREACGSPVDQNLLSNLTDLVQTLYNSTHAGP